MRQLIRLEDYPVVESAVVRRSYDYFLAPLDCPREQVEVDVRKALSLQSTAWRYEKLWRKANPRPGSGGRAVIRSNVSFSCWKELELDVRTRDLAYYLGLYGYDALDTVDPEAVWVIPFRWPALVRSAEFKARIKASRGRRDTRVAFVCYETAVREAESLLRPPPMMFPEVLEALQEGATSVEAGVPQKKVDATVWDRRRPGIGHLQVLIAKFNLDVELGSTLDVLQVRFPPGYAVPAEFFTEVVGVFKGFPVEVSARPGDNGFKITITTPRGSEYCPECGKPQRFMNASSSGYTGLDLYVCGYTCPDGHTWRLDVRTDARVITHKITELQEEDKNEREKDGQTKTT